MVDIKKLIFCAAMLLGSVCCNAQTKQALTLYMESGAHITYYLDKEPAISFKGQDMVVTVDAQDTDIPMQDVRHWEIGMVEYMGVEVINNPHQVNIKVYKNTLNLYNPEACRIVVYNLAGHIVVESHCHDVSFTLPHGMYVISIENNTYKVMIP